MKIQKVDFSTALKFQKVFLVLGRYWEDGANIIAARDEQEALEIMRKLDPQGAAYDPDQWSCNEIPGALAHGEARRLWPE